MMPPNQETDHDVGVVPFFQSDSKEAARELGEVLIISPPSSSETKGSKKSKLHIERSVVVLSAWQDSSSSLRSNTPSADLPESASTTAPTVVDKDHSISGRERLKRHRAEMAGRVCIPDMWGQENLLKDWVDCTGFDATLASSSIASARASLMEEGPAT